MPRPTLFPHPPLFRSVRLLRPVLSLLNLNRKERRRIIAGKRGKKGATGFALARSEERFSRNAETYPLSPPAALPICSATPAGSFAAEPQPKRAAPDYRR